jgi:FtsP/CotA-like multicopper oxidase with cupredoxin domain
MDHPMMGGTAMPMGSPMAGMEGMNYNYFTINGKAFPANPGWNLAKGELVRVRIMNISNLAHPMHLHGGDFTVIAKDGEPVRPTVQQTMNTLNVAPGETYDIAFRAGETGTWLFHCHELHHTENAGIEPGGLIQAITVKPNVKSAAAKPVTAAKTVAPAKPAAPQKATTTTPGGKK